MKIHLFLFNLLIINSLIAQKKLADLIVHNAKVYTVNAQFDRAEAFAVRDGKVIAVGKSRYILKNYQSKNQVNIAGKAIVPGFIDAHAHFYGYGSSLQTVDLVGTKSWDEILTKCQDFAKKAQNTARKDSLEKEEQTQNPKSEIENKNWLIGRGWDQNDWAVKEYPTKEKLDALFPKRPVLLTRVDGHAAIVNQVAFDIARVKAGQTLVGGEVEVKNGVLTGILIDNAIKMVSGHIPPPDEVKIRQSLQSAEKNCFAVGLTTVVDCGVDHKLVQTIEKMQSEKALKMRLYAMLSDGRDNYEYLFKRGIIKTDHLHVRSFKLYADGALGSRGACLLHSYSDRANHFGFLLKDKTYYESIMRRIAQHAGMQACTHAIGDSANREILRIYGEILRGSNDKRWRIEHAQVVNENDFALFKQFNIIPSVQPTHATSDMYWAGERLGKVREKGAYAFKRLLDQNGWIPLGTDFPVEDINPILTFYAAVARQDAQGFPAGGYQMDNVLSREETLRGMTIWAAKANFEEQEKGSIEVGKFADFVILNQDLMTVPIKDLLKTVVLKTYIGGEKVFEMR